jgi:ABC-2 type transport system permease protein
MTRLIPLWSKEWIALARDIHGLAVLFAMPAAFLVIMSLALSDAFNSESRRDIEFAVIAAGDPTFGERLAHALVDEGLHAAPAPADEATARETVRNGRLGLVLLVPSDFAAGLNAPPDPNRALPTFTLLADPALPPTALIAFRQRVLGVVLGLRVAAIARSFGTPSDPAAFDPKHTAKLNIEVVGSTGRPSSVQQNVPAWLIFGMFFVVLPIASLFVVERRDGTLARLVSMQVPFSMLLLGKVGPFFVVNLAQAALMLVAGRTLVPWLGGEALTLPARGDLFAAVAACTSLAAIGWGLLVAVSARTLEQATVIGGVGNILAAAVGGIMVPRFVMPPAMQSLTEVSPMAWALDGFHAVMLRHGGAADIARPCGKLLLLAAVLLAVAVWIHRHRGVFQ